jgi:hypothetical protein
MVPLSKRTNPRASRSHLLQDLWLSGFQLPNESVFMTMIPERTSPMFRGRGIKGEKTVKGLRKNLFGM